jgi:hypothetical protein
VNIISAISIKNKKNIVKLLEVNIMCWGFPFFDRSGGCGGCGYGGYGGCGGYGGYGFGRFGRHHGFRGRRGWR